jgi:hypothetical protein
MSADAEVYRCWQRHDAKRIGKRGPDDERTAIEDAAAELNLPYARVRNVVMARLMMRFGG